MSIKAQYNGTCAAKCGFRIHEGDEIQKDEDGEWRHVDCTPKPSKFDIGPREVICPDCRLVRPCRCLD